MLTARLNVPFVYSTNGQLFVEYDRSTGRTTTPRPLSAFPNPAELRARYEAIVGFSLNDDAARPLLHRAFTGALQAAMSCIVCLEEAGDHSLEDIIKKKEGLDHYGA